MRLVQFSKALRCGIGVELAKNGDILDLNGGDPTLPTHMVGFLAGGPQNFEKAKGLVAKNDLSNIVKRNEVKILPPITHPDKVVCIGMNYKDHCEEQNVPVPEVPIIFNKFPSTIIGPTEDIPFPEETEKLDWEVELVVVIGKSGKKIKPTEAMQYVAGYMVAQDVSARDWQMSKNGGQWLLGKSMDAFCPLGPALVTCDEIPDPHNLAISCTVNGEVKQSSNTSQMIHRVESLVAYLSRFVTLLPGDVILTGTPPGVGVFKKPQPQFLQKGDIVQCEIEHIGTICNKIV